MPRPARAGRAGGKADIRERQDVGFMDVRTFKDPDGHVFEPMWMDIEAASATTGERRAESA
jgi:predicted lactoylglutathione lyase